MMYRLLVRESAHKCMALFAVIVLCMVACQRTKVQLYVDGFVPDNVQFDLDDLGVLTASEVDAVKNRPDVDGIMRIDPGACPSGCRVAMLEVLVTNHNATPEPPPVVRIEAPPGRPRRLPLVFQGKEISPGRIGRIRWAVELWPEEPALTAVLSSTVRVEANVQAHVPTGATP
jgi:hypothetical protein